MTKLKNKGYEIPKWFRSLKLGSHGATPAQKKYWAVVSELVRKEDFEKYGGKCISCPKRMERWQDGQAAHWKTWTSCHSYFKYERKNLALSCANCNHTNGGDIGHRFGEELKRRYGKNILAWIEKENEKYRGVKMQVNVLVDKTKEVLDSDIW